MSPTLTAPETSEQLEELLNDPKRVGDLIAAGKFAETIKAYAKHQLQARNGELAKQAKEAVQSGFQEFLRDQADPGNHAGAAIPAAFGGGTSIKAPINISPKQLLNVRRQKLYRADAMGAKLNGTERNENWARFLQAGWHKNARNTKFDAWRENNERIWNAGFSERVPSEGGFLVPETLRSDLLMLSLENAVVRPRARVIPMDSLRLPYPTIDDPSHTSSVFGGVYGSWTEEGGSLAAGESQPTFGRVILEARKLTGYTEIPNELLSDSLEALDQFFSEMFPEALAFFEDFAFINGDGIAQPQGVLNASCAVTVSRGTSNEVLFADIAKMYTRMLPQSLNKAMWICSPDVIGQLLQLVLVSGSTPVAPPLWLQSMSAAEGVQYQLLGRPLIVTEKQPALGSTGDIAFVDWSYYLIGDRQTMQVSNSEHYKFANDLTSFRVIERVDGRPWLRSALTPANGSSNTLSPVVLLHS
jgi:HK97 family phage major capsid protein